MLDVLRLGAHQLLGMRVPAHAAVSETVGLAREQLGTGASQFVNAVLRAIGREPLDVWEERLADGVDELHALAAVQSHPVWVVRALREALVGHGRSADESPTCSSRTTWRRTSPWWPAPAWPRPTRSSRTRPARRAGSSRPPPWSWPAATRPRCRACATAVRGPGRGQPARRARADAVPVEGRDERWLDLCAGPGGKAALLAAVAGERGARIVANELQPHRTQLVEQALRAVPADAVEDVRTGDGRALGALEPASFDRVMVDAPCTGLGALRRRPEARWRRSPADLPALGALQRELLVSAVRAVRVGGVVAYVTCSPHLVETQLVVKDALRAAGREGLSVEVLDAQAVVRQVATGEVDLPAGRLDVQLWPHVHGTDAMHLTLLRRRA